MKFSEIVRKTIALAKAANKARMTEGPEDDSPLITSGAIITSDRDVAALKRGVTEAERRLYEFLAAQSPQAIYLLTALMYLGRGDFTASDLREHYVEVSETFGGPKGAVRQMFGTFPLPEFLAKGLKQAEAAGLDLDKLPPH